MLTLAYDETTGFEITKKEPAFITGFIYDSKKEKEYNGVSCERARLEAYFRAVCSDCGNNVRFPRDLHMMPLGNHKNNGRNVEAVKKKLNATLNEYLTKGTYKGRELLFLDNHGELVFEQTGLSKPLHRKGKYQFIAVLKGEDADIPDNAQVYHEMVKSIIQKGIYMNGSLSLKSQYVHINAPTRVIPDVELSIDIKKSFARQGYRYEKSQDMWFVLESGDIRGIAANLDSSIYTVDPVLFIRRIKDGYTLGFNDHTGAREFVFLFLADALCSFLKEKVFGIIQKKDLENISQTLHEINVQNLSESDRLIINENIYSVDRAIQNGSWLTQLNKSNQLKDEDARNLFQLLKKRTNFNKDKITSSEYANALLKAMRLLNSFPGNLIYIYDKYAVSLDSVNNCIFNGDYFTALSKLYDYELCVSTCPNNNIWNHYQKETMSNLTGHINKNALNKAIKNLDEYRMHHMDEVVAFRPDRLKYIFEKVLMLAESLQNSGIDISTDQKARLYDVGISAFTHVGDTVHAYDFYKKYMTIKGIELSSDGLPMELKGLSEETLRAINRTLTDYHDFFDYEKTERDACKLLGVRNSTSLLRNLKKILTGKQETGIKKNILKLKPICLISSTLGQTYAFMNNPLAETYFKEAMDSLYRENLKDQEPDYYITMSYLLQWYIEQRNQLEYENLAKVFFGGFTSLPEQLKYLLEKGKNDYASNTVSSFPEYALFIFIKAFFMFYKENLDNRDTLIKMTHIDQTVEGFANRLTGHPWEIIFKYAALLEEYDKTVKAGTNIKKSVSSVRPVGIIDLVVRYGELEYRESRIAHGHVNNRSLESFEKNYIISLWNKIKEMPEIPVHWTETDGDINYKREQLRKMFSYMYH